MRFVSRLHVCAAASILLILYFSWTHRSAYESTVQAVWRGDAHRLVVFGNDWSDTGNYRVRAPAVSRIAARDADRGDVWVETLCKELACNTIDNFAHSVPTAAGSMPVGSLVDSGVYEQAKPHKSNESALTSFDFKTQVEQYLTYDKGIRRIAQRLRKMDEWTFFTVFFGLWDLLEYSTLDKDSGMQAIDRSVEELFHGLDILADNVKFPPKVVIPKMIDVTFLPWFQSKKGAMRDDFAETQHKMVFLWAYWNHVLLRKATEWQRGAIYMSNPNEIIMVQVRDKQLHSRQISDASGAGKQAPLFEYVEQPCLASNQGTATDLQTAAIEKCSTPASHLFWNDVQLSGPAHQLIGSQAASHIRANQTVNVDRATQGSDGNEKPKAPEVEGFNLKFPPGY